VGRGEANVHCGRTSIGYALVHPLGGRSWQKTWFRHFFEGDSLFRIPQYFKNFKKFRRTIACPFYPRTDAIAEPGFAI